MEFTPGKSIYKKGTAAYQRTQNEQYEQYLVTVVTANFSSPTMKENEKAIETLSREIGELEDQLDRTQQMLALAQAHLLAECESILEEERVIQVY